MYTYVKQSGKTSRTIENLYCSPPSNYWKGKNVLLFFKVRTREKIVWLEMGRENMDPKEVKHFRTFCDFSYFEKKERRRKEKKRKKCSLFLCRTVMGRLVSIFEGRLARRWCWQLTFSITSNEKKKKKNRSPIGWKMNESSTCPSVSLAHRSKKAALLYTRQESFRMIKSDAQHSASSLPGLKPLLLGNRRFFRPHSLHSLGPRHSTSSRWM